VDPLALLFSLIDPSADLHAIQITSFRDEENASARV
jgi:hypothetical protein